jgi:hypothetical protein
MSNEISLDVDLLPERQTMSLTIVNVWGLSKVVQICSYDSVAAAATTQIVVVGNHF